LEKENGEAMKFRAIGRQLQGMAAADDASRSTHSKGIQIGTHEYTQLPEH
jgi:hypothetical protein